MSAREALRAVFGRQESDTHVFFSDGNTGETGEYTVTARQSREQLARERGENTSRRRWRRA